MIFAKKLIFQQKFIAQVKFYHLANEVCVAHFRCASCAGAVYESLFGFRILQGNASDVYCEERAFRFFWCCQQVKRKVPSMAPFDMKTSCIQNASCIPEGKNAALSNPGRFFAVLAKSTLDQSCSSHSSHRVSRKPISFRNRIIFDYSIDFHHRRQTHHPSLSKLR